MKRIALSLALVLSACGLPTGQSTTSATTPPANLSISADGAAGINAPIAMTEAAVTAAAPGFYVAQHDERVSGTLLSTFTLSTDDGDMFRLYPTSDGRRLSEVAAISNAVKAPTDETIGLSTYYQAPHAEVAYCESRMISEAAGFACSANAHGNLWRLYKLPSGYDGPSDPFDAIDPDAATDATLVEMRWRPPTAGGTNQ